MRVDLLVWECGNTEILKKAGAEKVCQWEAKHADMGNHDRRESLGVCIGA